MKVRVVGEQFTWTFYYPGEGGKEIASQPALPARGQAGKLRRPVQGRPARLLGPGLPHEDRRRARASPPHYPRDAGPKTGTYPGRLRRAVRPRPLRHAPDRPRRLARRASTSGWRTEDAGGRRRRPAAARRRRRRRRGARRQGALHRAAPRPPAAPATRSPTRARPAPSARTSTRSSRARTRPSSRSRSRTRTPRSPQGFQDGIMPDELRRHPPAGGAQGAHRLPCGGREQVTERRLMAAQAASTRAGPRGLFTVLGVAVRVRARHGHRALAYGFSNPFDGADGWDASSRTPS